MSGPDEQLRPVVAAGPGGHRAADDAPIAGRERDEPPVVRTVDEVERVARVWGGEDRCWSRQVRAATADGERQVDGGEALDEHRLGTGEAVAFDSVLADLDSGRLVDLDERAARLAQGHDLRPEGDRQGLGQPVPVSRLGHEPPSEGVGAGQRLLDRHRGGRPGGRPGCDGERSTPGWQAGRDEPSVVAAGKAIEPQQRLVRIAPLEPTVGDELEPRRLLPVDGGAQNPGGAPPIGWHGWIGQRTKQGREHRGADASASGTLAAMPIVGDVLADRYRIDDRLGAGGMATVLRAHDLRLDREVAIKVLLPNLAADPAIAERFEREARALAAASHPNVVAIHDVDAGDPATGREPFYVMELCDGGSLADRLAAGPLPPADLVPILAGVADGLASLHARGIVHRDVKPHNVLLAGGHPKLADFGLARPEQPDAAAALTATGTTVGTLAYLAPEVLAGATATAASDVYGLGVVAFEGLTGELPRAAGSVSALVDAHRQAAPLVSSVAHGVGVTFDGVIASALAADPAERPSAAAFGASMAAALPGGPETHESPGIVPLGAAAALAASAIDRDAATRTDIPTAVAGAGPLPMAAAALAAGPAVATAPAVAAAATAGEPTVVVAPRRVRPARARSRSRAGRRISPALLALIAFLAVVVALAGLSGVFGRGHGGLVGGGSATTSPRTTTSAVPRLTAAPKPTPAPNTIGAALDAVDAAIAGARGGPDGLKGKDANDLQNLASQVRAAVAAGDMEAARQAAGQLSDQVDALKDSLGSNAYANLRAAVDQLVAALPHGD